MPKKSNWFIVATEGDTVDGRTIERQWLSDIATTYDPKTYGARINLEHLHLFWFDPQLAHAKCYGDVLACKAEENADGKLQLYAQIEPTAELVELVKNKQKVYTSIEVHTNFAKTGKAYLTGLAVTDTPASLGTQYLSFSTKDGAVGDIFATESLETAIEFNEPKPSFLDAFKAMFKKAETQTAQHNADVEARFNEHEQAMLEMASKVASQEETIEKLNSELESLRTQAVEFADKFVKLAKEESKDFVPLAKQTGGMKTEHLADF